MAKSFGWRLHFVASAVLATMAMHSGSAWALSLGRVTVQSALGEPLRAEVEILDINNEELDSLALKIASPEMYAAAGLEYPPAMLGLQTTLIRRPGGKPYIRISGERSVNEPFVDMVLVSSWASGRIVRNYTMLFDPPGPKSSTPAPTLPQAGAAPSAPPAAANNTTELPATNETPASPAAPAANPAPRSADTAKPNAAPSNATPNTAAGRKPATTSSPTGAVTVQPGDTAGKLAEQYRSSGVSLDQMLVAMLNSNPEAFAQKNVNRLRAGAVLSIPSAETAQATPAQQATQIVQAQSKDFNAYRRNLASSAPASTVEAASQKASGSISAKVEDKKPSSNTPDKLTLSKGAAQAKAQEEKIAKERADKAASERAAELAKNIQDLNKLGAATAPAGSKDAAAKTPAGVPSVEVAGAPQGPASAPAASVTQAASATPEPAASAPASAPETPASAPKAPVAPAVPVDAPAPDLLDSLLEDPVNLAVVGGGVAAVLGGLLIYLQRRRKSKATFADSVLANSSLQTDSSFFGGSGGERVDTSDEGTASVSSMVYSASQLEAADNVDAIAEADVYMAYGRDQQAEDILKDALRYTPDRLAIHSKLAEIYGKRKDAAALKACALKAFELSGGQGPEWEAICKVGMYVDPDDGLYQSTDPSAQANAASAEAPSSAPTAAPAAPAAPAPAAPSMSAPPLHIDLDLDLDAAAGNAADGNATDAAEQAPVAAPTPAPASSASPEPSMAPLDFEVDTPPASAAPAAAAGGSGDLVDFDLSSLSLDLDSTLQGPNSASPDADNPLQTKLALAEEFVAMGDKDGARALIEEVMGEATGDLREQAQRALANLG